MQTNERLSIQGLGQVAIVVSHVGRAVQFYRDVLGLPLLFQAPPGLAFFDCGGVRLMLTLPLGPERDHRTSVLYYRVDDLERAAALLKKREVKLERGPKRVAVLDGERELWIAHLRDPDGNLLGLMNETRPSR